MDNSTPTVTTSSANAEVIARDAINDAVETIDNIEIDNERVEKQQSTDEIAVTQKTIADVRRALVGSVHNCRCECCKHNMRTNAYFHDFLVDMMNWESTKYRALRRYFAKHEDN